LRTRANSLGTPPDELSVQNLFPAAQSGGGVQVLARPKEMGPFVTGITFAGLGGMGVMTGGMLAIIGCTSDRRPELCSGGLISMGAGAVVAAGATWLILGALPKATVAPLQWTASDASQTPAPTVVVGPGTVAGTF
jgi:hypothetical protein